MKISDETRDEINDLIDRLEDETPALCPQPGEFWGSRMDAKVDTFYLDEDRQELVIVTPARSVGIPFRGPMPEA